MNKRYLTQSECIEAADEVGRAIIASAPAMERRLWGIPRGGIPASYLVAGRLEGACIVEKAEDANYLIDDLVDSGTTRRKYLTKFPEKNFHALFTKERGSHDWLVFPWERAEGAIDESGSDIATRLLQYIGEDPAREGLKDTPTRFLDAGEEYTTGYSWTERGIGDLLKTFEDGAEQYDELVLVRDIPVYSQCEHHLAPFFGHAHIAYIPSGAVLGLSKFARLVDVYARRLQVQERLTQQIAHALEQHLKPKGVGVVLECRHLCMEQRGVRAQGSSTTTSCLLGALKNEDSARAEFMRLVR